jgi:hypothetical protein
VSSAEPDPAEEIIAALVWDRPRLLLGSASAKAFAEALPGKLRKWWEPEKFADDTLGQAARAVAHERAGELAEAATGYASLAGEEALWPRLLGLMLRAWSESEEGTEAITEAQELVDAVGAEGALRARLLAKLATYAFDEGVGDLARELLSEAIAVAPPETLLRRALSIEGLNSGLAYEGPLPGTEEPLRPDDPLVDYDWIERTAAAAARQALDLAVDQRSRHLWTWQIGSGRTPLDEAVSAEVQATWAGALWIRRKLRKQLGAQLLAGEARGARPWAYGVVMWALGGGRHPQRIYLYAEPHLDQVSTDFIVRTLAESDTRPGYSHRFLAVAAAAWDAISDDTLRWAVANVEPVASEHPTAQASHALWAGYAARLPNEWFERFQALDRDVQLALVDMLGPGAVTELPDEAQEAVFDVGFAALQEAERPDARAIQLLYGLGSGSVREAVLGIAKEKAPPSAVAHLVFDEPQVPVTSAARSRARDALLEQIREEAAEAREGKVSFGGSDTRLSLARLVARDGDAEATATLLEVAVDGDLPAEHLLAARNALTVIRQHAGLSEQVLTALHDAADPPGQFPEHGGISVELLEAARLRILAWDLTDEEATLVVAHSRAPDAKTRQVAISICGEAIGPARQRQHPQETGGLLWALVGGVFDPEDDIVARAVSALAPQLLDAHRAAGRVVLERLLRLYAEGSTGLRVAVAELAAKLSEQAEPPPAARAVVVQAESDKSWLVRSAVKR